MRVSNLQLFWMIAIMELGMTLLMTMTASLNAAKHDAWISIVIAGCIALLIALVSTRLSLLYPDQTLVQFSETIMGKWLGKFIVILYLIQWYTIIPIVLRQFTDLIESLMLHHTPRFPIILLMVILMIYVTFTGKIQGIGYCSEILGPLIFIMVLVVLFANFETININNILPVYVDHGIMSILEGALAPASYLGHAVEFVMLTPFLINPRQASTYAIWAVMIPTFIVLTAMIMIILTLGTNLTVNMWYPFFEMTKQIELGFIENWDALAVIVWIASVFIKLSIYTFITAYGTAQFLKVKNWRTLLWFIAPIVIVLSYLPNNVNEATTHFLLNYWVPVVLPVNMIGLPLLMLIVGKIRQRKTAINK